MYRFYRKMQSGNWKYCETFNSTLDPNYHELINDCRNLDIDWELRLTSDGTVKFKSN